MACSDQAQPGYRVRATTAVTIACQAEPGGSGCAFDAEPDDVVRCSNGATQHEVEPARIPEASQQGAVLAETLA